MQTADNVARWFLSRNKVKTLGGEADLISNLKLQKLLYYAQGMHLALYDAPLFGDEIVAWRHGPVVESVYQKYKTNGSNAIGDFENPIENFSHNEETWKLADMTHEETPWREAAPNSVISIDGMKKYFEEHYIE